MVLSWILLYGTKARVIENLLPRFLRHKCTIICYDPWIVSLPLHMRVRDHTCKGSVEVCPTFIKYNIQNLLYKPGWPLHSLPIGSELDLFTEMYGIAWQNT